MNSNIQRESYRRSDSLRIHALELSISGLKWL